MSLVIKLKTGDMALRAVPPVGETTSGTLPPPEPALLDWAVLTPPSDDSHLAPCPHCGLPNGLSAASCWSCEANLLQLEPFRHRRSPRPAALASAHAPGRDDESLPVLASAVEDSEPTAVLPVAAAARRRHPWQTGVPILGIAVLAVAAFVYFDAPVPADAPKSSGGVVVDVPALPALAAPAVLAGTRPVPSVPSKPSETRDAAVRALAVEPDTATAAQAAQPASPTLAPARAETAVQRSTARAGKPRSPARPPKEATTALAVPKPDRVDSSPSSWQPPLPARPCTATVAALGLCAAAPTVTKE